MSDLRETSWFWYGKSEIEVAALSGHQIGDSTEPVDAWEIAFEVAALEAPKFWDAVAARFRGKYKREMRFEDVCRMWGGGALGMSQDSGGRNEMSRSSDDGIYDTT